MGIEVYNETWMCSNLYAKKDLKRRYGKEVISVIMKEFHMYAVQISIDM